MSEHKETHSQLSSVRTRWLSLICLIIWIGYTFFIPDLARGIVSIFINTFIVGLGVFLAFHKRFIKKDKSFLLLIVLILWQFVFLLTLYNWIINPEVYLGESRSWIEGNVASMSELPVVGGYLAELKTEGQVDYIYRKYHGLDLQCFVTGKTGFQKIEVFIDKNKIFEAGKHGETGTANIKSFLKFMGDGNSNFPTSFGNDDDYYWGKLINNCPENSFRIWSRNKDNRFVLYLELENQ